MKNLFILMLPLVVAVSGCSSNTESTKGSEDTEIVENLPAEGFDVANSSPEAIKIADDVMNAMGGRKNWDNLRGISWNFFGNRKLFWDKWTGDVRIKYLKEDREAIININTDQGRVMLKGEEITQPDSLNKYLRQAKGAWINDSYWLCMPFKLKDSGVTLQFIDSDTTQDGREAYLLSLRFKDVGFTPENYYEIWVDAETKLISQWAYYKQETQDDPNFIMPWREYKDFNGVMLSGNRGEREITEIQRHDSFPETFFNDFSPVGI
ncbi:MAG: hypothetical protein O2887_02060 [Bacteroidetes bacterium]|nr:hypothetical protein [Bacteroidota bacterium]MDA1119275.1 hypothetical protein [Bacteroidota bacterium]